MHRLMGQRFVWIALTLAIIAQPAVSRAFSTGIPSTVFGPSGCTLCHSGGVPPTVILNGPTVVDPGDIADYTLTIFGNSAQTYGGFNVAADGGVLSTGGPFAAGTQALSGLAGLAEITHATPKQGDWMNVIEFSFRWTAPTTFAGTVHLRSWGNNVNRDFFTSGDAATLATLNVVSSAPTATPTATPTPGPDLCVDAAPLDPPLITEEDAQRCQKAVAKAGALYTKQGLKAVQNCLKTLQGAGAPSDPISLCAGTTAAVAPTDGKAAAAFAKGETKLRALITGKCTDSAVAALGLCATTAAGLADCLLTAHHQGVVNALGVAFGNLQPTEDPNARRCQGGIGKNAGGFLSSYLKASQKCLNSRNKDGAAGSGAAACIGSMSGGFVPPTDEKVAATLLKATGKLSSKVTSLCTETDVGNLDACAGNKADLIECLVCGTRSIAFDLLGAQYGGN